jgi:hypothetical protein
MKPSTVCAISMELVKRQLYDHDPRSPAIREDPPEYQPIRTVAEILRDLRNGPSKPEYSNQEKSRYTSSIRL